jgi:hypothetical protein
LEGDTDTEHSAREDEAEFAPYPIGYRSSEQGTKEGSSR